MLVERSVLYAGKIRPVLKTTTIYVSNTDATENTHLWIVTIHTVDNVRGSDMLQLLRQIIRET